MRVALTTAFVASLTLGVVAPAKAQFGNRPSIKQQIQLGQQAADELRKKEKVLPSTDPRVRTLRRVAGRLLSTLPKDDPWEYSFDVIDSKDVNAFALPGGPTFFYTGLLDKLKTEDELAGVLGHELTHVRDQHWARHVADAQKRNLLLSLGLLITRANSSVVNGAGLLNNLYDLKYSRGDETQADDQGFSMMVAAGFNPKGMADVFRLLQAQQKGGTVEFLSDHPSDKNRIQRIEDKIDKNKSYPPQKPLPY